MLGHQFAYSVAPIRKVKEVQFGIISPDEIVRCYSWVSNCAVLMNPILHHRKLSMLPIEHPEVMDKGTHKPKIGGLVDPRMGTINRNFTLQMANLR